MGIDWTFNIGNVLTLVGMILTLTIFLVRQPQRVRDEVVKELQSSTQEYVALQLRPIEGQLKALSAEVLRIRDTHHQTVRDLTSSFTEALVAVSTSKSYVHHEVFQAEMRRLEALIGHRRKNDDAGR